MTRKVSTDRRGRVFVDGFFLEFEEEVETFRALAGKYLHGALIVDPSSSDRPMFFVYIDVPSVMPRVTAENT